MARPDSQASSLSPIRSTAAQYCRKYPRKYRRSFTSAILAATLALTACSQGKAPSKSWEVASKGTYSAAFSDDAKYALVGSINDGGSLWRTSDQERLYNWNHQGGGEKTNIIASAISPEGNFAFTADHLTMVLWEVSSGKSLTYWTAPAEVLSVALTPNGNYAMLALDNHQVVLFDAKRGGIKRSFNHQNRVRSVDITDDGNWAVSGAEDNTAVLWNVNTGGAVHRWQMEDEVRLVAIAPDGSRVFTVSKYDKAMLWRGNDGKAIGEIPMTSYATARGKTFTAARFSPDGSRLLTGTSDRLVQLWDSQTQKLLETWELPKRDAWKPTGAAVEAVVFASSKTFYAIASNGFIHQLKR